MAVAACARTSSSLLRGLAVSRRPPLRSIHEGPDTIDELLDCHLAKKAPKSSVAPDGDKAEFEEARGERDPEVVARVLIGGRDAVQQALDRLAEASRCMVEAKEAKRRSGAYNRSAMNQ
ncbi:hypothetical protein E2562_023429 [Oryza meyeriana var. granulata]|uniref:Uncharacterized protein n=1 Tax=Oryza meyeriana var. granulata TaxID=110450 RepID=A0A6G1FB68_9ORYZ|nr:hypothetical protein E2562_023429 [Oryza meyeriana var. granulata]